MSLEESISAVLLVSLAVEWTAESALQEGGQAAQAFCPKPFDLNESKTIRLCEWLLTWRLLCQTAEFVANAFLREGNNWKQSSHSKGGILWILN